MKVDEFIEDLEALCKQYWKKYAIDHVGKTAGNNHEEGIVILFDNKDEETK